MSLWHWLVGLLGLVGPTPSNPPAPRPERREPRFAISGEATARFRARYQDKVVSLADEDRVRRLLRPAEPLPGVVPKERRRDVMLAMDQDLLSTGSGIDPSLLWPTLGLAPEFSNLIWLGYPYLSELSQRSEYRQLIETTAMEMTRRWAKITSSSEEDRGPVVRALTDMVKHYDLQAKFRRLAELDGFFGRGQLYIDDGSNDDDRELMLSPLIDDARAIRQLERFVVVEPAWTYPGRYNSINPLRPDFFTPQTWYVMGKEVHRTRLMTFVAREVPDLLKPAYAFGGISLTQLCKPAVDNFLRTRQSVSDLLHSFNTPVLLSNLSSILQGGGGEFELKRAQLFNFCRDNQSLMMIDKESEDFKNVSAPLGTLDQLQAQAQEQMAMPAHMPLVILAGLTPHGLNASSEGEIRVWEAWVLACQQHLFSPHLRRCLDLMQLVEFGKIDPSIGHEWESLHEQDEKERAEVAKIRADTIAVYDALGAVGPQEVREVVAEDEDLPFANIDVSEIAPGEEDRELQQQQLLLGAAGGGVPSEQGQDAEFEEAKHPRSHGKFTAGAGSSAAVHHYLNPESEHHSTKINAALRKSDLFTRARAVLSPEQMKIVEEMDRLIEASKPLTKPMKVYRGSSSDYVKHGVYQPEFHSVTTDPDTAEHYAAGGGEHGVVYEITTPKGTRMLNTGPYDVFQHGGENERVLPRGGRYFRGKERQDASGRRIVPLEFQPPGRGDAAMGADAARVDPIEVGYVARSSDESRVCQRCKHWLGAGECARVVGAIDPYGWCELWASDFGEDAEIEEGMVR